LVAEGVPEEIARRHAFQGELVHGPDIIALAHATGWEVMQVARAFFMLGERVGLDWLEHRLESLPVGQHWQRWAAQSMEDDLFLVRRQLVEKVITEAPEIPVDEAVEAFFVRRAEAEERLQRFWHDYYDALRRYYGMLDRIDAMLQNGTPATTPKGVLAGHVQATAAADQRGNELLNAYHTNLAANPQTGPGYAADLVRPHSYGIAHHVGMPLGEAAIIALEAYHHGGVLPAIGTAASTLALQPVINKIADAVSAQGQSTAAAEAMRKAMGKPTIDLRNPIHRLLFGGYLANQ
jgi:hypothetical protein